MNVYEWLRAEIERKGLVFTAHDGAFTIVDADSAIRVDRDAIAIVTSRGGMMIDSDGVTLNGDL